MRLGEAVCLKGIFRGFKGFDPFPPYYRVGLGGCSVYLWRFVSPGTFGIRASPKMFAYELSLLMKLALPVSSNGIRLFISILLSSTETISVLISLANSSSLFLSASLRSFMRILCLNA
jgi:hypothetical protein